MGVGVRVAGPRGSSRRVPATGHLYSKSLERVLPHRSTPRRRPESTCFSAAFRSAQSASSGSSPTLSRTRFSGTRSPSQRRRVSMVDRAPPRLVAFDDRARAGLDLAGRCGTAGDVEREQPAEARVAHALDGFVGGEPLGDRGCALGVAAHPDVEGGEAAVEEPRRLGEATMPVRLRSSRRRSASPALRHATAPSVTSWWPVRYLVAECRTKSAPSLERAEIDGGRGSRVDEHARRMSSGRVEVGHRQERVRRRLEPDQVDAVRRRARLVELDEPQSPASRARERGPRFRSRRPRRARSSAPGRRNASTAAVHAPVPDANSSASPPSSSPSAASAADWVGFPKRA